MSQIPRIDNKMVWVTKEQPVLGRGMVRPSVFESGSYPRLTALSWAVSFGALSQSNPKGFVRRPMRGRLFSISHWM